MESDETGCNTTDRVLQAWSVGDKCTWPRCTSKAVFRTKSSFSQHLRHLHTKPLVCTVPNCSHKMPFGRLYDLRRHGQSVHSKERSFVCEVDSCGAKVKEFARKDHLTKHLREMHDRYYCPKNHCINSTTDCFIKPEDLTRHLETQHGPYECSVMACARMPPSSFTGDSLQDHLHRHHRIRTFVVFISWDRLAAKLGLGSRKTLEEADLPGYKHGECKLCGKATNSHARANLTFDNVWGRSSCHPHVQQAGGKMVQLG